MILDQDHVPKGNLELLQRRHNCEEQKAKLHGMQSRHAGRGLLN